MVKTEFMENSEEIIENVEVMELNGDKAEKKFVKRDPQRTAGMLLHISSLPSDYGIGTFGKSAYDFVDFLKRSKMTYWQVLPLGPTSYGDSPYQSYSSYAGNPYFIDLDILCEQGLLAKEDYVDIDFGHNETVVDFEKLYHVRNGVLRIAYDNAMNSSDSEKNKEELESFKKKNSAWLEDYALFMALKKENDSKAWSEWDTKQKKRDTVTMNFYKKELEDEINYQCFVQKLFFEQYFDLKKYANENGIKIFGDLPIYVAHDSADMWANLDLFAVDRKGDPKYVGGCPPDDFTPDGQLWGNPIYHWKNHEKQDYAWWCDRVKWNLELFDTLRIDHFRGFEAYWQIPYGDETAVGGKWVKGPGIKLFNKLKSKIKNMNIIAEDLGVITDAVNKLRLEAGFPGMKVLQFAFDRGMESEYLPHNVEKDSVMYTGTHDNKPVRAWFGGIEQDELDFAVDYFKLNDKESYEWGMIRGAWASPSKIAIAQLQDFLCLGAEARMNKPNTLGNWQWRMKKGDMNMDLSSSIAKITETFCRASEE